MVGYLDQLRSGLGQGFAAIHRAAGFQADYLIARDTTVEGMSTLLLSGIFIQPTPLVSIKGAFGGRVRRIMSAAGNLAAEALPIFLISRPVLVDPATDIQYEPTLHDEFRKTGTTGTVFRVLQVTEIAAETPGWFVTTTRVFRDWASIGV